MATALGFRFPSAYQKIESGQHEPSAQHLRVISETLGVSINDLILGNKSAAGAAPEPQKLEPQWLELLLALRPEQRALLRQIGDVLRRADVGRPLPGPELERLERVLLAALPSTVGSRSRPKRAPLTQRQLRQEGQEELSDEAMDPSAT